MAEPFEETGSASGRAGMATTSYKYPTRAHVPDAHVGIAQVTGSGEVTLHGAGTRLLDTPWSKWRGQLD